MPQLYEQLAACPEAERSAGGAEVEARRAREGAAEAEEIALTTAAAATKGDDWETEELSPLSRWASKLLLLLSALRADAATRRRCLDSMPSRKNDAAKSREKAREKLETENEFLKRKTEEWKKKKKKLARLHF